MAQLLHHYLRTHRRRSGFSQDEIARLLGSASGTRVSRYERFARNPCLDTVFAYEIIFKKPIRQLFAGRYEAVRLDVRTRALQLSEALSKRAADHRTARKLSLLREIVESKPLQPGNR